MTAPVSSSPAIALASNEQNSPPDVATRNRAHAIGSSVIGESPETTPPESLAGRVYDSSTMRDFSKIESVKSLLYSS